MWFLKTSEYAIRVLIFMASQETDRFSVSSLHRALGIPYKYLGRLMRKLAEAGLLESTRGKSGGYTISRPKEAIYLSEIVDAVEGSKDFDRCLLGLENCSRREPCPFHHKWEPHRLAMHRVLTDTSLANLVSDLSESGEKP